ncbi:MAG TPA: porin [Bryobacteraceae bacterium]
MIQSTLPVLLFSFAAGMACAQTAQWHGIAFSGLADGYYSYNNNHSSSGLNQLYTFDDKTDQWDLNLLKATASEAPTPVGFRVDLGLGRAMEIMHAPSPDPSFFNYVEQAYVSLKPKQWKGFEADFGDFVTSAGAEVIETKDDWNYSRSLLFTLAIPFYHFGVRTSMPVGSGVTVGLQLVNGWNEIVDTHGNNMQTVGITAVLTRKMFTWSDTYYTGPQYTNVTKGNRSLYDTTLLLTPWTKFNAYLNFDYGRQHGLLSGLNHWEGIAVAARYQLNRHFAISPRVEYYDDATGFTTGARQRLHEVTLTGEYKVIRGFLARIEYRHDGSDIPFYTRGNAEAPAKTQSTVSAGLIAYFPAPQ